MSIVIPALLAACFGGSSGDVATDQPADGEPARPNISCPEGSELQIAKSPKGDEQYCERGAGIMHGPFLRYYPNGKRSIKGAYDNNLPDGDWIWWHENEKEASKGKYNHGKQVGAWTWWHPNGNRAEEGDFLQGRKAGQWILWYETGAKKEDGMFHNGMKDGTWTYFNDDSENTIAKTERYENGALVEEHATPKK